MILGVGRPGRMQIGLFRKWLRQRGKSEKTAACYMSQVCTALQSPEAALAILSNPEEAKRTFLEHETSLGSSSRSPFRAAIRSFDRFLSERGHPSICPTFPDARKLRGRLSRKPRAEHPLVPHLPGLLKSGLGFRLIELTKWKHVSGILSVGYLWVRDPIRGDNYKIPTEVLRQINLWAGGGSHVKDLNIPLVPREPLSQVPMSAAMLRSLMREWAGD